MGSEMQPRVMRAQIRNLLVMKFISINQKFYAELKKVYVMRSEMQPRIIRAQKSEKKLIFEINKDYWHVFKYQSTVFNHLGLFMFIGSSIADTQHIQT
jgi:hypothetical protein